MNKYILIVLFSSLSVFGYAQNQKDIVFGKFDSIDSKILNEQRPLMIYLPNGYSINKSYPVVYLLDGYANYHNMSTIVAHLSWTNDKICPEMIVVGIPNTNRNRDLTPYKPSFDPHMPQYMLEESGGGEEFISFIEKELMPYIESKFSTAPYRVLFGASLGGFMVLHTLLHHTELFNAYIATDPTTDWVKGRILREFKDFNSTKTSDKVDLFIGMGSFNIGQDKKEIIADPSHWSENYEPLFDLDEFLTTSPQNNINYSSKFYKNENHFSVRLLAAYDGIRSVFDFYTVDITASDRENPEANLAEKIRRLYDRRTKGLGYKVKPEENYINDLAKYYLSLQHFEKARQLFELNVNIYPNSSGVYDSIGDYYVALNENEKAIENYKKALSITEIESTRNKLNKIQNK
ncbi:MAG TPA: esterase [Bacteroidales bacterium]|nr:esterase [Bacteroidales bacterium]